MSKGTIRQILLITDGCSNQGEDPVRVSEQIAKQGISVNVIGVLEDDQTEDPTGLTEVNEIAEAGNGVSRIVYAEDLSETVQMVTQQAITQTIQGYVSKELKDIFGKEVNEDELSPETKEEVHEIVEDLGETVDLQVLILIDTSASMQHKMSAVRESLNDLVISLRARMGNYYFSIYHFPTRRQITEKASFMDKRRSRNRKSISETCYRGNYSNWSSVEGSGEDVRRRRDWRGTTL